MLRPTFDRRFVPRGDSALVKIQIPGMTAKGQGRPWPTRRWHGRSTPSSGVSELSIVEASEVEQKMLDLAAQVYPELTKFTPAQTAAYNLAHALRNTFMTSWRLAIPSSGD